MDADGEEDSQFSAFTSSLSWWMMKSLWKEGMPDQKLKLSVADTFLLKDGHLQCWYFTSSKSGRVLKRANKRLDWDGLVKFLLQQARIHSTKGATSTKDAWPPGVIATARRLRDGQTFPMMLTASDFKSLREKHNADLLDEIVAVQPYVTKTAFMGCGLFETEFSRKGRHGDAQAALSTFELAQWPQGGGEGRFEGFPGAAEPAESRSSERRNVDRSAKRVHGVLHRVLAMTTRSIVEHVEKETDEVILRVVAQYAFVPGKGQPTLLWLDSVETGVSSTQKTDLTADDESDLDANAFMQLTRELVETNRSWTTFFPPKMADIATGRLAAGSGQGVGPSPRSRAFSEKHEDYDDDGEDASQASKAETSSRSTAASGLSSPNGALYNPNAAGTIVTPISPESHPMGVTFESQPLGVTFASPHSRTPTAFPAAGHRRLDERRWRNGHEGGFPATSYAGGRGSSCRDNFTLPTESWARRSSRWSGLDGWGTGGAGGARSGNKQWVRRRSTGTTMKFDDRRLDLRHGSESHRPQTAPPPRGLREVEGGGSVGKRRGRASGTVGGPRLPSKNNGCYGDYCSCEGAKPADDAKRSGHPGGKRELTGRCPSAPNLVPYRSILRSRAEEKALSLSLRPKPQTINCTGASLGRDTLDRTSTDITPGGGLGLGLVDLGLRGSKRKGKGSIASILAERMRVLAANISDEGRGEYFSLKSSDRERAGAPEAAQRGVEELLYEEALSHLHPTTIGRPVAVCDTCAMVYGQMDLCRKQTKSLKALAGVNSREARIACAKRLRQEHLVQQKQQLLRDGDHTTTNRRHAVGVRSDGEATPLRRYSELNLTLKTTRAT